MNGSTVGGGCGWPVLMLLASCLLGCGEDDCRDGDRSFASGQGWTCSDGCNFCSCDDGQITSTLALCLPPPGPAAGKLVCREGEGAVMHGHEWQCDGGCATCVCDDGRIRRTQRSCDAVTVRAGSQAAL